ncbi:putative Rdx family selenoprotein [Fusibacter tunisiensis]|uniref:Rdx family selenoprotein n=1 Tax=Fusibacter tunisiensis TaxID=1008308 RepID=A0ABS2MP92_9FIRM|nr:putative Rdx family selenoprotein [Fusibacter tunisiensis]
MEVRIKATFENAEVELVKSSGGIFTVAYDGAEIFNNFKENVRHPDELDILERLKKVL